MYRNKPLRACGPSFEPPRRPRVNWRGLSERDGASPMSLGLSLMSDSGGVTSPAHPKRQRGKCRALSSTIPSSSLALFEVAQFFRAEGSTRCRQWRKPLDREISSLSALKGRQERVHVAPSGISESNAHKPVARATGYNVPSLSGLKSRNFKTGASGFDGLVHYSPDVAFLAPR